MHKRRLNEWVLNCVLSYCSEKKIVYTFMFCWELPRYFYYSGQVEKEPLLFIRALAFTDFSQDKYFAMRSNHHVGESDFFPS